MQLSSRQRREFRSSLSIYRQQIPLKGKPLAVKPVFVQLGCNDPPEEPSTVARWFGQTEVSPTGRTLGLLRESARLRQVFVENESPLVGQRVGYESSALDVNMFALRACPVGTPVHIKDLPIPSNPNLVVPALVVCER